MAVLQEQLMSGGHFDYIQYTIGGVAEDVEKEAETFSTHFTEQTIEKFLEAAKTLEMASKMLQRVDWLLSGDDGEDAFNRRWEEDGLAK